MNYLTKLLFFSVLLLPVILSAQEKQEVEITGSYTYPQSPDKRVIEISFSENGSTCGPGRQFETVDDQFAYLISELSDNVDIVQRIKEIPRLSNYVNNRKKKHYIFTFTDTEEGILVFKKAQEAFASHFKFYDYFRRMDGDMYRKCSKLALENAFVKAKELAEVQGLKEVRLLSIQDYNDSITDENIVRYRINTSGKFVDFDRDTRPAICTIIAKFEIY